ncbi:MAG: acyl-CoA dehydrogenase family protein [Verrucomicrobiia bacterium]
MRFCLTKEQESIRSATLAFARGQFSGELTGEDRECVFNREGWNRVAEFGLLRGFAPREYGGDAWDTVTRVAALEAFGYGCRDNGLALALSSLVWCVLPPLLSVGSEEQKERYVPKLISGVSLAADAITEEEAGSDAMAMQTRAEAVGEGYKLNGEKRYIGLAPIADLVLLYARTDPAAGAWGLSAFLVETGLPGIKRSENQEKMGMRTLPTGTLTFRDCLVPASARLGEEGVGMGLFNETMEWERSFILATQMGAMAHQLDRCIDYAKHRRQFGKPIAVNQSVSHRIADMKVRLETCRLLLYKAAWLKDQGHPATLEASMTKLCISEAFVASSLDAIRIHGAKGYMSGFQVERDLRDATGGLIYAGTSDIQRNLIARLCGL